MAKAKTKRTYKRILLKLSGESLMGGKSYGIDDAMLKAYADEIIAVARGGTQWPWSSAGATSTGA